MKKLFTLLAAFALLGNVAYSQCDFTDDYSSNTGWTQVGSNVVIANGKVEYQNGAADGEQRRVHKDLGFTLDANHIWSAEFEFYPTGVGTWQSQPYTGHTLLAITAGTQESTNNCPDIPCTGYPISTQDCIKADFQAANPPTGDTFFYIWTKDDSAEYISSEKIIANTLSTIYYLRLERLSSTLVQLSVFSDSARTVHLPNSPISDTIPNTVMGLTTVQHGNVARGYLKRELNGSIDNLCINYNITGINENNNNSFLSIYPNPTAGKFEVRSLELGVEKVEVYDLFGRLVLSSTTPQIDMRGYAKGVYFVKIGEVVRKLVKQ